MLVNYYIIKNEYIILNNDILLPNINFFIYYIDNYSFKIVINILKNDLLKDEKIKIKIYSIDKSINEILDFDKNELLNNITTKIFLEYYNNFIPKFIPPRNLHLIKNKYYIKNNNISNHFNIVIYYINENECTILIRNLDDENDNINLQIIIECLENKKKEIIFIDDFIINIKTNIFLEKLEYSIQNIPKNIFQTGSSNIVKNIIHYNSIMSFIDLNPDYSYYYYDNIESRRFLRTYFDKSVNDAYDILVPGAYKADLLRYCLLYIYGGCYFDCKQILLKPLNNIIKKDDELLLCKDFIEDGILNAVMLCEKNLDLIKIVIDECRNNIINKVKICPLSISGPRFLYNILIKNVNKSNFILQNCRPEHNKDDYHKDYINNNIKSIANNDIILYRFYKGYYNNYLDKDHYGKLFHNNEIYYKNIIKINGYMTMFVYPNNDDIYQFNYNEKIKNIIIKNISNKSWGYNLILLIINDKTYEEIVLHIGPSISQYKEIIYE
jgi:mannosyltransferase OCH1-like enzyme